MWCVPGCPSTTEFKKTAIGCFTLFGTLFGRLILGYIVPQIIWSITRNDIFADAVGGWVWLVSFPVVLCFIIAVFVPSLGSTKKFPEALMGAWLAGVTWSMCDVAGFPANATFLMAFVLGLIGVAIGYSYRRRLRQDQALRASNDAECAESQ